MSAREQSEEWGTWDAWDRGSDAVEVVTSELVVTMPSSAGIREYEPLAALLRRAYRAFGIEMAFVSEWCGEPVVRTQIEADALHTIHGWRVLEAHEPRGAAFRFDALPVVTAEGNAHGTLCFRLPKKKMIDEETEGALRGVARLIATWFEAAAAAA
jgi:hypothetical protein